MAKINRNDNCPCGSGKKYKKCCLNKSAENDSAIFENARQNVSKLWSNDKINPMTNAEIFEKLETLGISLNEEKFIEYASQTISSEKLAKRLEKEAKIEIAGYDADFPWIAMNILWQRLSPSRPCIESIHEQIVKGYSAYDDCEMEETFEIWNQAWDSIIKLFAPLTKDLNCVDKHYEGFEVNILEWVEELIALYCALADEDESFYEKRMPFLKRLVETFSQTRHDLLLDAKIIIAHDCFNPSDASPDAEFEKLAGDYFNKSMLYSAWALVYGGGDDRFMKVCVLKKAETILESGLFAGVDDPRDLLEKLLYIRKRRIKDESEPSGPLAAELKNAKKWEDKFLKSPLSEKTALLSDASESGAAREMLHYIDITGHFMNTFNSALSSGKINEIFEFLYGLQNKRRELYLIFSHVIDNFIISCFIHKGEFERALSAAQEFCLKIGTAQVLTASIIEKFIFCRKTRDAIDLCERIAEKRWPELIDKLRARLSYLLFNYDMQSEYIKIKNGGSASRAEDLERYKIYGRIFQTEEIDSIFEVLRGSFSLSGRRTDFKGKLEKLHMLPRINFLLSMTPDFAAFMFEKHGVDFPLSHTLWSSFIEFTENDREGITGPTPAAKLFTFSSDRLKKIVKSSAESMFFPFEEIGPVLSGGPFIYQYLFENGIIDESLCDRSTVFFNNMRKYAESKYPAKMWAFKLYNLDNTACKKSG